MHQRFKVTVEIIMEGEDPMTHTYTVVAKTVGEAHQQAELLGAEQYTDASEIEALGHTVLGPAV